MATKIFTQDLRVGMFVADLDRPWVDTPFLLQGFLIESNEQITALREHCQFVIVDRARSTGDEYEAPAAVDTAVVAAPRRAPVVARAQAQPEQAEPARHADPPPPPIPRP